MLVSSNLQLLAVSSPGVSVLATLAVCSITLSCPGFTDLEVSLMYLVPGVFRMNLTISYRVTLMVCMKEWRLVETDTLNLGSSTTFFGTTTTLRSIFLSCSVKWAASTSTKFAKR
jgi:hypothetical protein